MPTTGQNHSALIVKTQSRGRPTGTADKEATLRRIRKAAVRLLRNRGLEGFNLRALAKDLNNTAPAALYHFGSKVGLLAAVAEYGFDELSRRLEEARASAASARTAIMRVTQAHARFGLEDRGLYRAIHSAELWHSLQDGEMSAETVGWIELAKGARELAFKEVEGALGQLRAAHSLRTNVARSAQMLTALVDGYLFQVLEENVGARRTIDDHLREIERLVELALDGLVAPPRR